MVCFNFLLPSPPTRQRARYSALHQMVVTFALAGGAAFGSWLVTAVSYQAIFFASGVGRVLAAFMFARMMREDKPTTPKLSRLPMPPAED